MKGEALFCFPDFIEKEKCYYDNGSRLCGVVVSVLETGPKVCGIEPGQGDWILRVIKIRNTPSSRMGSKDGRSQVATFRRM
jgi:hypothetical protein